MKVAVGNSRMDKKWKNQDKIKRDKEQFNG